MRLSAAQLTELATQAQLQAEVYRCISAMLAAESSRGRLGYLLPRSLAPAAAPEPAVAPARFCLFEDCPSPSAPPLQQRRCAEAFLSVCCQRRSLLAFRVGCPVMTRDMQAADINRCMKTVGVLWSSLKCARGAWRACGVRQV